MNMMSRIAAGTALATASAPASALAIIGPASADYDPKWAKLVEDYRAAVAERDRLWVIFEEAEERWFDAEPEMPALPTRIRTGSLWNADGTVNDDALRDLMRDVRLAQGQDEEYNAKQVEWTKRCAEVREQILGPSERVYDAASGRAHDLLWQVIEYPVRSLRQLSEKVAIMKAEYAEDIGNGEELKHVADDVQRLALAA